MRRIGGYLRPATAAQYLGIPLEEVQKMLESGELPGVKIGSQWRVPLDELEKWLDEEVPPAELKKLAQRLKGVDPKKVEEFLKEQGSSSKKSKGQRKR